MRSILFLLALFLYTGVPAQEPPAREKVKFRSTNLFGVATGQKGASFQMQSINGISWKTFSIGVGVALDEYGWQSLPLFLDVRKDLFNRPSTPFIYLDGGRNFPQGSRNFRDWGNDRGTYTLHSGLYYDLGIGLRLPLERNAVVFSAGYSHKAYSEDVSIPVFCTGPGICNPQTATYTYTLRRITIKAGFRF